MVKFRIAAALALLACATPVFAQRYAFERAFDTTSPVTLDAATNRGKITVTTGPAKRVTVRGTVTVRVGIDVPANAVDLAQRLAAQPPVEHSGDRVQLRPPANADERRAVTIAYDVIVPPDTRVVANSDSGALSIAGVSGAVTARTQSGALAFSRLGGAADIATGSGAVEIAGAGGAVDITTSSSAITAQGLRSHLRVKTGSGAVSAESVGPGDIDITTSSSAITVTGAAHGVRAESGSGKIRVSGRPAAAWTLSSSSGAIDVALDAGAAATLDATTRSGSIHVTGVPVDGTTLKQRVQGTVGTGGPAVTIAAGSGSIDIRRR